MPKLLLLSACNCLFYSRYYIKCIIYFIYLFVLYSFEFIQKQKEVNRNYPLAYRILEEQHYLQRLLSSRSLASAKWFKMDLLLQRLHPPSGRKHFTNASNLYLVQGNRNNTYILYYIIVYCMLLFYCMTKYAKLYIRYVHMMQVMQLFIFVF